MSTEQRRLEALCELIRIIRVGGLVLVYVWALEQDEDEVGEKKVEGALNTGNFNISSDDKPMTGVNENDQNPIEPSIEKSNITNDKEKANELEKRSDSEHNIEKSNLMRHSYESHDSIENDTKKLNLVKRNEAQKVDPCEPKYIQVAAGRNTFQQQDLLVPWHLKSSTSDSSITSQTEENKTQEQVFHRFYHVFKRGELEQLCCRIPNVSVKDLYLDRGNWCIILQKDEICSSGYV